MKFLSNAHTHTPYCDGLSDIPTLVKRAQELGFVSLGFSGHGCQGFDPPYSMEPPNLEAYIRELRELQDTHNRQGIAPKIYVGVEQDTFTPPENKRNNRRDFDYIIGSVHYLSDKVNRNKNAVDSSTDMLLRFINDKCGGDVMEMAKAYYRLLGEAMQKDKPDIIAHFDLVRKHAKAIGLDTESPVYKRAALDAMEQAFQGCQLMEVNTGIIAKGYDTLPYPAGFLLDAWREMGGKLTLTSDCHNAKDLDCAFPQALQIIKSKGFKRLYRLGTGKDMWDEIAL